MQPRWSGRGLARISWPGFKGGQVHLRSPARFSSSASVLPRPSATQLPRFIFISFQNGSCARGYQRLKGCQHHIRRFPNFQGGCEPAEAETHRRIGLALAKTHSAENVGRFGYSRRTSGAGGCSQSGLDRAQYFLSSKAVKPQVGVARMSPFPAGTIDVHCESAIGEETHEEVRCSATFGRSKCPSAMTISAAAAIPTHNGYRHGAGAQAILLPTAVDCRLNAGNAGPVGCTGHRFPVARTPCDQTG